MAPSGSYDLLVVGGGNAALCAALSARARGLAVLIVEAAPKHFRGGNSRHTRNVRTMHERPLDVLSDSYPEEEYWLDLVKVTGGLTDEKLARMARNEYACETFMGEVRGMVDTLVAQIARSALEPPPHGGDLPKTAALRPAGSLDCPKCLAEGRAGGFLVGRGRQGRGQNRRPHRDGNVRILILQQGAD